MILHLIPFAFFFITPAPQAQTIDSLGAVKTIHVSDMAPHQAQFRAQLIKELSSRGFLVSESENADATIIAVLDAYSQEEMVGSGAASVSELGKKQYSYCTAVLKSRDGAVLWKWEAGAGPKRVWDAVALEPVTNLAFKLASALDKDYKKAQKTGRGSKEKTGKP